MVLAAVLALSACKKGPDPVVGDNTVRIEPVITRALSLNFNNGNQIGLDVVKADGTAHASNARLTYSDGAFSGDLKWYAEGGQACTLKAYFPYQEAGFPAKFAVQADQSKGTESSDLMVAVKNNVYPSMSSVVMNFKHQFAQVVINVDNSAGATVENVTVKGLKPAADIAVAEDGTVSVAVDEASAAADILAEQVVPGQKFCAVVVPQSFDRIDVALNVKGGSAMITSIDAATLKAGFSYNVALTISSDSIDATISGDIEDWQDGGDLGGHEPEPPVVVFEEFDDYFMYDGLRYNTVVLAGRKWMAEPLAFLPYGVKVSDTPGDGSAIYYPYDYSETYKDTSYTSTGAISSIKLLGIPRPLKDAASIKAKGYLYTTAAYLGEALTEENFTTLEGARGICPEGWHIPSRADWLTLVGNSLKGTDATKYPAVDDPTALFYDKDYKGGKVPNANAAGLNLTLTGAMTVTTSAAYGNLAISEHNSTMTDYFGKVAMTYYACSSPSSAWSASTKMFFAVATTFSLASYPEGRLSIMGNKVDNAVQVRCVKD